MKTYTYTQLISQPIASHRIAKARPRGADDFKGSVRVGKNGDWRVFERTGAAADGLSVSPKLLLILWDLHTEERKEKK